jgi:hypothetical protein
MYRRPDSFQWTLQASGLMVRVTIDRSQLEANWQSMGINNFPQLIWEKHPYRPLGSSYNVSRHRITVDVKGLIAHALKEAHGDIAVAKRFLTQTLVHESRHVWQRQNHGRWFMYHDHLTYANSLTIVTTWVIYYLSWAAIRGWQGQRMFLFGASVIATCLLLYRFPGWYKRWSRYLFSRLSYGRNWIERDANRYSQYIVSASEWQSVVSIDVLAKDAVVEPESQKVS